MTSKNNETFDPVIQTTDESGNIHSFKLVEIVEVNKQEYGLFEYIDPSGSKTHFKASNDDDELIVMRIVKKKNDYLFEVIDDENEFNSVLDYIDEHEDELEFE